MSNIPQPTFDLSDDMQFKMFVAQQVTAISETGFMPARFEGEG